MRKRTRLILGTVVSILLTLHVFWLIYLFHNIEASGIFSIPLVIFIALGAGGGIYRILEKVKSELIASIITIGISVSVLLLQVFLHPITPSVFVEARDYWMVYTKYPVQIEYEDLAFGDGPEMVAAMAKYQDELPDKILAISHNDPEGNEQRRYWAELKGSTLHHGTPEIQLVEDEDGRILLIINPNSQQQTQCELGTSIDDVFRPYYVTIMPCSDSSTSYYASELSHNFYFNGEVGYNSGATNVFALILSWCK
jgi:hypothetical protein